MNQSSKRILTGLHQIQQENKMQPDKRRRKRKEREVGRKTVSPMYYPYIIIYLGINK